MPIYSPTKSSASLWIIPIMLWFFLACGFMVILSPPGGPNGVAAVVTRGRTIIAIRPPNNNTKTPQQQIEVYSDDSAFPDYSVMSSVGAKDRNPMQKIQKIQLSPTDAQELNTLRQQLCEKPPVRQQLADSQPFYDVGVRCPNASNQFIAKEVRIPLDALPPALQRLIEAFQESLDQ